MQKMKSSDISIIIQGPINKDTKKCLKSIRHFFPEAEVILSTWEGSDVTSLQGLYNILVLNKDPGAEVIEGHKYEVIYNNINRQLLSIKAGLKQASRKYAMKLRSDLVLTTDKFLEYFNDFPNKTSNYNLFERKIITSTLFTRYTIKNGKFYNRILIPFHISDWWFFGLKKDLDTYFADTELVKEPEFTKYFDLEVNKNKFTPYGKTKFKFAPEQYFCYSCFERNFKDIYMEDAADYSDELMDKFREILVNNFIILEFKQSGIYTKKYPYSKNEKFSGDQYIGLYNFYRYEKEYKKFCDKNYSIRTKDTRIYENEQYGYDLFRIYKHCSTLSDSRTGWLTKLEQIFISIPIAIISFFVKHYKDILWRKHY